MHTDSPPRRARDAAAPVAYASGIGVTSFSAKRPRIEFFVHLDHVVDVKEVAQRRHAGRSGGRIGAI